MPGLGVRQLRALDLMRNSIRSGPWSRERPPWIIESMFRTLEILASLERRGLVRVIDDEISLTYELTDAGRAVIL